MHLIARSLCTLKRELQPRWARNPGWSSTFRLPLDTLRRSIKWTALKI